MRILLINLARAVDRRIRMERQFAALGLAFERLEAIDGRQLTAQDRALVDDNRRRRITRYPLSDNEIGCWLSHRRALQDVAASGDGMAAIVEDDAELSPDFPRVLEAIGRGAPDFDFIFLHRNMKKGETFVPSRPLLADLRLGRVGPAHMRATGYVVSAAGARRFLAYAPRAAHAVDKEIHRYWANGLDLYGLERPVVFHADRGRSFIEETREQERPATRERYSAADAPYWRLMRFATRVRDSVQKRIVWARLRAREERRAVSSSQRSDRRR
jgi:glycosyl transferase, family 25